MGRRKPTSDMAGEWREVTLGDLADEITVGHVGTMVSEYVGTGGVPFLRSLNVEPFRVNGSNLRFITPEFHARLRKSTLRPGDVVIVRTGKPGATALIPDWLKEANCSDLVIVRPGKLLDRRFLVYFMNSVARQHVSAHLVGAVQQHFNVGSARQIKIRLPSLKEQQAIACILGALDDKIELNRRMNRMLEAMARAIFKSWFMDFDPVRRNMERKGAKTPGRKGKHAPIATSSPCGFALSPDIAALFPDAFQDSPRGPIPQGWRVKRIEELAERVAMGPFGSSIRVSTFVREGIPVISGQHLRSLMLDDSVFNFVTREHADQLHRSNVQRGDVVFTHAGSIGQVALIPNSSQFTRYVISQRQFYSKRPGNPIFRRGGGCGMDRRGSSHRPVKGGPERWKQDAAGIW